MDETLKRKERLQALKNEAETPTNTTDDSNQESLMNPLDDSNPAPSSQSSPSFDYYTDPLAAFSNKKKSRQENSSPRPTKSTQQNPQTKSGFSNLHNNITEFQNPNPQNQNWQQPTKHSPFSPNPPQFGGRSSSPVPRFFNSPDGPRAQPFYGNSMQNGQHFYGNNNMMGQGRGSPRSRPQFGFPNLGHGSPASSPPIHRFCQNQQEVAHGSPFRGNSPATPSWSPASSSWNGTSPGLSACGGRGGGGGWSGHIGNSGGRSGYAPRGRGGRGFVSSPRSNNRGRNGENVSAREQPELFVKKSMVEDPWKHLLASVSHGREAGIASPTSKSEAVDGSGTRRIETVDDSSRIRESTGNDGSVKLSRFRDVGAGFALGPSLAESLAFSLEDAVNDKA